MASLQPVRFYCEFCGSLVKPADRICPHCGSFFNQVRCPVCQFQGDSKLFAKGCPACGFTAPAPDLAAAAVPKKRSGARAKEPARSGEFDYLLERKRAGAGRAGIPRWVPYLLALVCLVVGLIAISLAPR